MCEFILQVLAGHCFKVMCNLLNVTRVAQTGMCMQRDKVQFEWMTNFHSTVFATSIDPVVLWQVWEAAQSTASSPW